MFFEDERLAYIGSPELSICMCKLDCCSQRVGSKLCSRTIPIRGRKVRVLLTRNNSRGRVPLDTTTLTTSNFSCMTLKRVRGPRVLVHSRTTFSKTLRPVSEGSAKRRKCVRKQLVGKEVHARFIPFTYHSCRRLMVALRRRAARVSLRRTMGSRVFHEKKEGVCEVVLRKVHSPSLLLVPRGLGDLKGIASIISRS